MSAQGTRKRANDTRKAAHDSADAQDVSMAGEKLQRWLCAMERLRLAEYVRYAEDRRRVFISHFLGGLARGVGMAVGFTVLGAVLVLFLQDLAARNLPVIGDFIARIVSVVQNRLE